MPHMKLTIYADDTALYTTSRNDGLVCRRLQSSVDSLMEWSEKWRLRINESKCETIRLARIRNPPFTATTIGRKRLPWKPHIRYIGVTLDTKLIFNR